MGRDMGKQRPKAFCFTPADGRTTANAYWMDVHVANIPKVNKAFEANGFDVTWLHGINDCVDNEFKAKNLAIKALAVARSGDVLVPVTTGWNWPAHAGVIFTMMQDLIRSEAVGLINVCNMKPKAPGYVGTAANVLALEIMHLPYERLTIIDQSDVGWAEFTKQIGDVLAGRYRLQAPSDPVNVTERHRLLARKALKWLRLNCGFIKLINANSMTMFQGWPNVELFLKIGAVPIFVGSHEFEELMYKVPQARVDRSYRWLKGTGIQIEYERGGLSRREIDLALRMMLVKVDWINKGCGGIGTQGQMEQIRTVATDLSESLVMSSRCYGKLIQVPNIDVTEADCEALFTSLIMRAIMFIKYGRMMPVGFHDIRHYCSEEDTMVLLNSGAQPIDYLVDDMSDWSDVRLVSQNRKVYFLNGGAAVYGNMRPSKNNTLARFHGSGSGYKLLTAAMDIEPTSWENRAQYYGELDHWPFGKAKIRPPKLDEIVSTVSGMTPTLAATLKWVPNHGQHVGVNIIPELTAVAEELGIDHQCFSAG